MPKTEAPTKEKERSASCAMEEDSDEGGEELPAKPGLISYDGGDDEDGQDSLLHEEEREVVLDELIWVVSDITDDNDCFLDFCKEEGLEDVIDYMVVYPHDEEIQSFACAILVHFFRLGTGSDTDDDDDEDTTDVDELKVQVTMEFLYSVEESLLAVGLVDVLVHAIRTFPRNVRLQTQAIALLLRIVDDMRVMTECKIPQLILWSILEHLNRKRLVTLTLHSLFCRLQGDEDLRLEIVERGVLPVLALVLEAHRGETSVQRSAQQLLFLFVDTDESSCMDVIQLGLLPKITRAMKEHLDDRSLLMAACGTIWHLANESEKAKVMLVKDARAIPYLVRVLFRHADCWKLHVMACGALCSLALSSDPYVMTQLLRSRVSDALGASLYLHQHRDQVTHPAFVTLVRMDEFSGQIMLPRQHRHHHQQLHDQAGTTTTSTTIMGRSITITM